MIYQMVLHRPVELAGVFGNFDTPGAIQYCHLIRSGLDCQILLSEATWRLQSEKQ
jgi:hypothetical protein